jgi:hypothetical protein
VLAVLGTMLIGTSCSLFGGSAPGRSEGAQASPGAASSHGSGGSSMAPCQPAPDWLVTAVTKGLAVTGATLSEVYVGPASVTSGPPDVMSSRPGPAWWIVAKINGAGVRPAAAVWVTNRTAPGTSGEIFAANASALRYSTFGQGGQIPIRGDGQEAVLACLSPIPES